MTQPPDQTLLSHLPSISSKHEYLSPKSDYHEHSPRRHELRGIFNRCAAEIRLGDRIVPQLT